MKRNDHHLVQRVLDGDVTREAFDGFQQRLRDDPEFARLYEGYALLHHTLSEEYEDAHFDGRAMVPARRHRSIPAVVAAAALLALAAVLLWLQPWLHGKGEDDIAVVTFSVDAVWQIDGTSRNIGGATGVGKGCGLHLRQGRAGISLEPSVTAVIEGPADVEFLSENSLYLANGRGFFQRGGNGDGLTVTTPRLTAVDSGTEFGIEVPPNGPDELHVAKGRVRIVPKSGSDAVMLAAGDAARIPSSGAIMRFPSDGRHFADSLGRFHTVVSGPFKKSDWRMEFGNPSLSDNRIDGANFSAFLRLPRPEPSGGNTILLATLDVGKPAAGEFHTDGWAGMSFFSNGREVLFFGDSYGSKSTWSLDVKQHIPVILPEHPVAGPKVVTLRYDMRSGTVSLHEGGAPLKAPFCEGKLPAGIRFDEIRLGASAGAALAVSSLNIRSGGD